ncbi:DUF4352 domain-containing protein [Nocardiopsis sp. MG754419]|uniref:DUF4352 domain-containing protein n=1 Tax=Nocardiopsis sp. MG754419 TaxID=2259865 RepID=UPI002010EC3C|nr:DUF4352 domain-containing protein [Nocardiopsis sp. MG754419]
MLKRLRFALLTALVVTLPISASSSVLAAPRTDDLETLGTASSNEERSNGFSAEAHLAERGESGSFVSVTWSIENIGNAAAYFNWPSGRSYMYSNLNYFSGVTVTSDDGAARHHPLMDATGNCLCSGNLSFDFKEQINPGEQVAYWSMYSVPEDVDTVTLEIPGFEPIEDIPIS